MSKWMLSFLVAILMLTSTIANPEVLAASLKEMQQEKKDLDKKKNEITTDIDVKKSEINTNKSKIDTIRGQIQELDNKVKETNGKIKQVENEISQTTKEIEELHSSIKQLEKRIEERDLVLRDRIRAMQAKGGNVNYLDVLLGANSFSDFIDRFSAVSTLMEADKTIMKQQAEDKAQLEDEKKLVEQKLAEQKENKSKLEGLKASLDSQKIEKDKLKKALEVEQAKLNKEKASLEAEFHEVHEISKELQAEIAAEQKRAAEMARKLAEEKKRREAAERAKAKQSNKGSNVQAPAVSSGDWTTPAYGRTYRDSEYGYRTHPIYKERRLHAGIDIANNSGTQIVAAGDGVVSRARFHSSFGNYVVIAHNVNGKIYATLYAHLSSFAVSQYQAVSKGQFIGSMGSTGDSTGPHLHFEFHVGEYAGSSSSVNPRNHVPF